MCESTSDISRSRTGSASAFNRVQICTAWSALNGSRVIGEQHATVWVGVSSRRDFDMYQY